MCNRPVSSVLMARSSLVPRFFRVTLALAMIAPDSSVTVPTMVPRLNWPDAIVASAAVRRIERIFAFMTCLSFFEAIWL